MGSGAYYSPTRRVSTIDLARAGASEWRTPPLWGCRDSAPYLHDGRAATLRDAIALHGNEASKSMSAFNDIPSDQKEVVIVFLKSLRAPGTAVSE